MDDYDAVYDYLNYPTVFSKNQRRVLRRRCLEHFLVQSGVLYYSNTAKSRAETGVDRKWKMVVRSTAEKERVLRSCHSDEHSRCIISFYFILLCTILFIQLYIRRAFWS